MPAARYRKKPVEITAIQWHGESNCGEVFAFLGLEHPADELDHSEIRVTTIHGETAIVRPGDWIVPEPAPGRYYPVKPDIFAATYEPADDSEQGGPDPDDRDAVTVVSADTLAAMENAPYEHSETLARATARRRQQRGEDGR